MTYVTSATFENGIFKPDDSPALPSPARVRLVVETLDEDAEKARKNEAREALESLWRESSFDSGGERMTRAELHERR
jgi:predicted DNA-binding antitoxin AbrB/MazE fold protein